MCAVDDGAHDGAADEASENEDGTADAGFVFRVAVGIEDLVEETGNGVEETHVDAKGDEDDVEGGGA